MKNLADAIENFIISELLREREEALLVQRNELAERLSCAPSQISYVLSTRFTPERGFLVESRRGSGGFVKIVRVEPYGEDHKKEPNAIELVEHIAEQRMITGRERALLEFMLNIIDTDEDEKKKLLRQAMVRLDAVGRR
ncbi:MAG: CtsR family transcriptional regulator [Acidaminococcaceae bacterium]|nr:CtsR family transcriptional regulator [Acidaminococcaceae bacterium]